MSRIDRLFELIQILRRAEDPMTAAEIGTVLEVDKRTIYRDIAALQAMRVPIEGEAGIGYIMRPGYDLPPLMFDAEEVEAIVVGLALIGRTGDKSLRAAAGRAAHKIADVLPDEFGDEIDSPWLYASDWHEVPDAMIDVREVRAAIRNEAKLRIDYTDLAGRQTRRTVRPLALTYFIEALVLAAWCELRRDFRHFRIDCITSCKPTGRDFRGEGEALRARWHELQKEWKRDRRRGKGNAGNR